MDSILLSQMLLSLFFSRWNILVNNRLRATASKSLVKLPLILTDTVPVSSETTIATASVSSVTPIAALCLVPRDLLMSALRVSGRKHPAAIYPVPFNNDSAIVNR